MHEHKLQVAPEKSEALYLVGRKRYKGVELRFGSDPIQIKQKAKYLGVVIDRGLTGKAHVEYVMEKASKAASSLIRLMPRMKGAPEETRRLLATVAESIALYAAPIWADMALSIAKNRKRLLSTQRTLAIRVARAYRTVSLNASLVLARMMPWDLLAEERAERYLDGDLNLEAARTATIAKWQTKWARLTPSCPGGWTRSLIEDIPTWLDRKHGELTYHVTQVLSGHGQFQTYMMKIGKTAFDICVLCDSGEVDGVDHTILKCNALEPTRTKEEHANLRNLTIKEMVVKMLTTEQEWQSVSKFFGEMMLKKEELENARRRRFTLNSQT